MTMKQLYYTSCRTGKSVGGSSGFQVRAVSADLPSDRVRAAIAYVGYSLPATIMPTEKTVATAPVRLALLNTRDAGRLLCHSAYVGQDPMTGRFGNFFSHALLDVPDALDATQAIQTWGSAFWHRCDDDGDTCLKDVSKVPADMVLQTELARFLAEPPGRRMLGFVLHALVAGGDGARVFLAAPAKDVALCVYAVTKALPKTMLGDLTFSTYESDPLTCNARLVGSWWGDAPDMDLPSSCYSGSCLAYNSYSGRQTELSGSCIYADFAIKALAAHQEQQLGHLGNFCERYCVSQTDLLDLVYRLHTRDGVAGISAEECQRLFQHPQLAEGLVARPKLAAPLLEKLVARANEDTAYYHAVSSPVTSVLSKGESLEGLSDLAPDTRERLRAWVVLHAFLDGPSFEPRILKQVADSLGRLPEDAQRKTLSRMAKKATHELFLRGIRPMANVQRDMESFLLLVGPSAPKGVSGLFTMVRRCYSDGGMEYWQKPSGLLAALFAIALGDAQAENLGYSLFGNRLEEEMRDLIGETRRRGGQKALWLVEYQARAWDSPAAQRRWEDLSGRWINRTPLPLRILKYAGVLLLVATVCLAVEEWKWNRLGLGARISGWFSPPKDQAPDMKGSNQGVAP
jgi:hypothetical protein